MPRGPVVLGSVAMALIAAALFLPVQGQIIVTALEPSLLVTTSRPRFQFEPSALRPGADVTLTLTDTAAWPHVALMVGDQYVPIHPQRELFPGLWSWVARFSAPDAQSYAVRFLSDCHAGCLERGRFIVGDPAAAAAKPALVPNATKLGAVFASPVRNWHGRQAWDVELHYCSAEDEKRWGLHGLAEVVGRASAAGLRVLVRVAYDRQQSLPPADDEVALARYLACVERLARDERLRGVYGYAIGSGFNTAGENAKAGDKPTHAEWYARVFNGFGVPVTRTDNVVQRMRAIDPTVRVLVGSVTPWKEDLNGSVVDETGAPWLNYMATLVSAIDQATREKARAGFAAAGPDGFAVQAPGRPDAPEVASRPGEEPLVDLRRSGWNGAQAGFRVYRDWMRIVNGSPTTMGLPIYVSSTNTFAPDADTPPAQNYPKRWLTSALRAVNEEPQVHALVWFLDQPPDDGAWDFFSLGHGAGRLSDAAEEFDRLLTAS